MQFGIDMPPFGEFSDPALIGDLAREAEEVGWDGFFLWDHIGAGWPVPISDPWIDLAVIAMRTRRIKLGALVTPLPRRRPWKVARETVTLDHLSQGRLIVGVGIGSDMAQEYTCYGESPDDRLHAAMLDEGLAVLTGLWQGEPFSFAGTHYQVNGAHFLPQPRQHPRIPIWVAGFWPNKKPFRRAAQWDGVCPVNRESLAVPLTPADFRAILAYIRQHRSSEQPFDVIHAGQTTGTDVAADRALVSAYAEAGVTWWLEMPGSEATTLAEFRRRIQQGPPRLMG